jgi:Ca2+-binding RTX toxin-like protein
MFPKRKTRRSFQFEDLEARQLMAADLFLDFGNAFSFNATQNQQVFQVEMLTDNRVNGPLNNGVVNASVPGQLTSLLDGMVSRGIDYDQNGTVNVLDADALSVDVVEMVNRIYEPFDVNVKVVGSANMNQVIDKLDDQATNDAYIFIAGQSLIESTFGIAAVNIGNTRDNVAFAYANTILDDALEDADPDGHPFELLAQQLARTAAHEAAHTFGLRHLLETEEGLTADQLTLSTSDIMDVESDTRHQFMSLFTRWDGLPTENGTQNAFQVLANNVGLKANGPAYVTGTGASDTILIQGIGNNQAQVTVSAFRDADHTDLIETQSYVISTVNGVLVEGGRRNDRIEAINLTVPVTLRGGQGQDVLIGTGSGDVLEGDSGNDSLLGAGGSDIYLFRGPRYLDLGSDSIDDTGGARDTLDFSQLDFAINVNLASTLNQEIEKRPSTIITLPNGQLTELTLYGIPFDSRLNLDLTPGTGTTGIENVRGSAYSDRIHGNELNNQLFGFAGSDWMWGYGGLDELFGGSHNDILRGGDARDLLFGELGRDDLFGEAGNDRLDGGYDGQADTLNGGAGADEFVQRYRWEWINLGYYPYLRRVARLVEGETLADFNAGLGDVIVQAMV